MTKAELISRLAAARKAVDGQPGRPRSKYTTHLDVKLAHNETDEALVEFINDPEIKPAYDALPTWYP